MTIIISFMLCKLPTEVLMPLENDCGGLHIRERGELDGRLV